jgi:hypothetical protein
VPKAKVDYFKLAGLNEVPDTVIRSSKAHPFLSDVSAGRGCTSLLSQSDNHAHRLRTRNLLMAVFVSLI